MKLHFRKWISSNWPVIFLVVFEIVLAAKNIVAGTWLMGWDSTQPELNLKLNLARSLTSVWQEYRGLGLPDGMAHAANIVHLFYVWILSYVVPDNLVRYVFVFLAHLVGGIGVYTLLQHLLKKSKWSALAGASFYLLNPITIQMFYQPLELFIIHFAGLPWLVLTLMKYLEDGGRRNLAWMAIVLLAFVSQNHVPTIFIVTMMAVGMLLLVSILASLGKNLKRILAIAGVLLGINSFWLLPYMVTTVSNAKVIPQAKMNLLSNPEVILRNAEYGYLDSVVRMQGFSLSYEDWRLDGPTGLQMPQWASWWDTRIVVVIMWVLFGLAIVGIIKSVRKRDWKLVSVGMIWILALFNLGVRIPVIDQVMTWVYANVPLYAAVFRFAFTKFSIVFALTSTILMIYALDGLVKKWGKIVVGIVVVCASLWIGWPVFSGNFLYKELRLNWPIEYQGLFKYFDKAEIGRVARLPAFDLWGWESNNWGYRGSGIIWQGVKSPMLLRSFDPWSSYNEGFYNEFSTASYGGSSDSVQQVLNKYDVRYVLLDESVIAPGQDKEILRIEETKRMAEELGWEQKFKEGFLTVWEVNNSRITNDKSPNGELWMSTPETYILIEGDPVKAREDVIFNNNGSYVSGMGGVRYPFASLMKENPTSSTTSLGAGKLEDVEWGDGVVRIFNNELRITEGQEFAMPGWEVGEVIRVDFATSSATTLGTQWEPLPAYYVNDQPGPVFLGDEKPADGKNYFYSRVSEGEEWMEYRVGSRFKVQGESINIEVRGEQFVYDFAKQGQGSIGNCDVLKRGVATKTENTYFADERGAVCDYVVMEAPFTRVPHLLRLRGENIEGRSIKFFLYNTGSKRNDIEYLLGRGKFDQTFSLLPWEWDGYYTLNIETRSFGERAENRIDPMVGMYVPLEKIAKAKIVSEQNSDLSVVNNANITHVKKTGTWLFGLGVEGDGLIKLSQGYDEGWIGINIGDWNWKKPFDSAQGLRHVKVDGWANGFILNNESGITNNANQIVIIFYWPQLLQYLGFVVLGITILLLVLPVKTKSK